MCVKQILLDTASSLCVSLYGSTFLFYHLSITDYVISSSHLLPVRIFPPTLVSTIILHPSLFHSPVVTFILLSLPFHPSVYPDTSPLHIIA